jgi:hypothetical protein
MKKSRFTESQVVAILKEAFGIRILNAAGFPVPNCHGAHPPSSFNDSGDGSGGCAIPAPDGTARQAKRGALPVSGGVTSFLSRKQPLSGGDT